MTYASAAKPPACAIRDLSRGRFPPGPARAGRRRGRTVVLRLVFCISPQRIHLRCPAGLFADAQREHCAPDIRDHRLCRAGGLLPVDVNVSVLTPFHFVKHKRVRVLARCAGDAGGAVVARLRDPGRDIVRHRRDREGPRRRPAPTHRTIPLPALPASSSQALPPVLTFLRMSCAGLTAHPSPYDISCPGRGAARA